MKRRTNLAAATILTGMLATGIAATQTMPTPLVPPEATFDISVIRPEKTVEPEATLEVDMSAAQTIDGGGISFLLPAEVAADAAVTQEPADEVDLSVPPGGVAPAHTRFTFLGYAPTIGDSRPPTLNEPELLVFRTADFPPYTFGDATPKSFPSELAELQRLLAERPELGNAGELPALPLVAGHQTFHARESYIDFNGGSGIMYLTMYALAVDPLVEGRIVAVFQGVTDDGETYISAAFPLDTGYLPDVLAPDLDVEAFERGYEALVQSVRSGMNEWPSQEFSPTLGALRALFKSISVE